MKQLLTYLAIFFLITSCSRAKKSETDGMAAIHIAPVRVDLNIKEGYVINSFSGDTIQPLFDSRGNYVKTGIPVPAKGKIVHSGLPAKPETIRSGNPKIISANLNVHRIPKKLTTIAVNKELLKTFTTGVDTSSFLLINFKGDTVPTGVAFPVIGKVVPCIQPHPVSALAPRMKDIADINMKYLDVEQGMNSSYVLSILEDSRKNMWFGTLEGGVSLYNGETFTHYTENEGLSGNSVRSMLEDRHGNIWFGTQNGGVTMYNGETFTHFTENEGLCNNFVLCITEDSHGRLWFGTSKGGVTRYDGKTFTNFTRKEGLSNNSVRSIVEDHHGDMWFGTDGGGVCRYDGKTFVQFTKKDGLSNNSVMPILEDSKGNLWFGTWGGGVSKYDGESFTNFTTKDGLIHNFVDAIVEDKNGNLWFGTWEGVSKYNGESFTNYSEKEGLSYIDVYSMLEDSRGNLWFGTWGGGVNVYSGKSFSNLTREEGLSDNHVFSILEDSHSNLWFGSWGGVSRYNDETFAHFTQNEGLSHNFVYSILEDRQGNLWFGTAAGGVNKYDGKTFTHFTNKDGLGNNDVSSITEDRNGNIWFGTKGGGVSRYNGVTLTSFTEEYGLSNNIVNTIVEDHFGNLWFGTGGGGVSRYDGESFTHFTEKEGLSNNVILSIMEDSQGNLWFGTDGGGVNLFNGKYFTYFTEKEGLSNNIVNSIVEDCNHNIWLGTEKGLNLLLHDTFSDKNSDDSLSVSGMKEGSVIFTFTKPEIHTFSEPDGLKGMNFYQNSVLSDSKNRIWWGSGKSLTMLDMNKYKISKEPPSIQLNRIEINEQFADYNHLNGDKRDKMKFSGVSKFFNFPLNLELSYNLNHITFYFAARDGIPQQKLRYSCKMEGLTDEWSLLSSDSKADFRNLSYGNYTLKVHSIGEAQQWSDILEYSFYIHPPWWATFWFRVIVIMLILSSGPVIYQWRTRVLRKRKRELEREVENRTVQLETAIKELEAFSYSVSHDLRAPLRFVNGYTRILLEDYKEKLDDKGKRICSLIASSSTQMGELIDDLLRFSRLGRSSMNPGMLAMKSIAVSVFNEIAGEKGKEIITFKVGNIHDSFGDQSLIKQVWNNLISNAIKYSSKMTSPEIIIGSEQKGEIIIYFVTDNGVGFDMQYSHKLFGVFQRLHSESEFEGNGVGLAIVQRIVSRHGGRVWAEGKVGKGATFYFSLPVNDKSPM